MAEKIEGGSEEQFEISSTVEKQLAVAQLLQEQMDLEREVILLPDAEDARWVGEEAVVLTPDSIESGRREVWVHEIFRLLLEEEADGDAEQFKSLLDQNAEIFYRLITEIGRESISSVLEDGAEALEDDDESEDE